jgi:hypothetical protein
MQSGDPIREAQKNLLQKSFFMPLEAAKMPLLAA